MNKGMTYTQLEQYAADLEKRLEHLLQSETIQLFDEIHPATGEYRRDIRRLDTYGLVYKLQEYERTGRVAYNSVKVVQVRTRNLGKTVRALNRLTKASKEAREAYGALFKDNEGSYEITPEVLK